MFENATALVISIKEIMTSFSVRKFLFWFISIFLFVLTSLFIYEYYTGNFYYQRINNKIDTIVKIDNQVVDNSSLKKNIEKEYSILIENLNEYKIERKIKFKDTVKFSEKLKERLLKFLSALIIPLIIIIWGRSGESVSEKSDILVGGILIAIIGGFGAMFIPTIYKLWVNLAGFPIVEAIILLIVGSYSD